MGRKSTAERRAEIVAAALDLLATTPVDALGTRALAKAVGLSQPALFRHFRSRDAILVAVVEEARAAVAEVAVRAVALPTLEAQVRAVVGGLAETIDAHPGLPRLLFHDAATGGVYRDRLSSLVAMQRALVAQLVSDARDRGEVGDVDPGLAGEALIALVQGHALQWRLAAVGDAMSARVDRIVGVWLGGLEALTAAERVVEAPPTEVLISLDVRPILASGVDPLEAIQLALGRLAPDGLLRVIVPFRPKPLLALLGSRGFRVSVVAVGGLHRLEVFGPEAPEPLDLRDLPAPEPLERVLREVGVRPSGSTLIVRVPRVPRLLMERLAERGVGHAACGDIDGTGVLHLRVP